MKLRKSISLVLCLFFLCLFKVDTFASTKLAKPTGVTVTADSNRYVRLVWSKVKGAKYYYVYTSTSKNGKYTKSTKITVNGAKTIYPCKKGKTYYYKVKAYKSSSSSSSYSSIVSIKISTSPAAPKNVKATYNKETGKVKITWSKVSKASGYNVYCSNDKSFGYQYIPNDNYAPKVYKTNSATIDAASWGIKEGETWYFKVVAIRSKMESKQSSSASVKLEADEPNYFPLLSDVPVVPNVKNYTMQSFSDGTVEYIYSLDDIKASTLSDYDALLRSCGWSCIDEQDGDGYTNYYYYDGEKYIGLREDDTNSQFIIAGYLTE